MELSHFTRRRFFFLLTFLLNWSPSFTAENTQPPPHDHYWLWAGGATGLALLWDRSLQREFNINENGTLNKMLGRGRYGRPGTFVERMGEPYSTLLLSGIFYGVGKWKDDSRASRVGRAGLMATTVSGVSVLGIKWLVGRNRPYAGHDVDEFRPFRGTKTSRTSFPSGHAAIAFTMASVVATEYDNFWIDTAAYGAAGAVAVARVYQDRHWASDIVAGSALGIAVGKWAVRRDKKKNSSLLSDGRGVYWVRAF